MNLSTRERANCTWQRVTCRVSSMAVTGWVVACRHALDSWQSLSRLCLLQHTPVPAAPCTQCHRGIPSLTHSLFCAKLTASKAFRAAACGFHDDALHFLCSTNIWLASSWCVCWLHLLRVSSFQLSPSLSQGCQRCETAAIRIHGCELSLSLSHSLSQLSSLARCLSQSLSLPLSFPLFLLFCLSYSVCLSVRTNEASAPTERPRQPSVHANWAFAPAERPHERSVRTNEANARTKQTERPHDPHELSVRSNKASARTKRPHEPSVRANRASARTERPLQRSVRTNEASAPTKRLFQRSVRSNEA